MLRASKIPDHPLEFLWFALIGIAALYIFLNHKRKPLSELVIPELEKRGFKFISSKSCRLGFFNNPFDVVDEDVSISAISGGLGAVQYNVHSVYREVIFIDKTGKNQTILVSLDFKSYWSKELKRIRWYPSLDSI